MPILIPPPPPPGLDDDERRLALDEVLAHIAPYLRPLVLASLRARGYPFPPDYSPRSTQ